MGRSFGCVDIDIEAIFGGGWGGGGGVDIVYQNSLNLGNRKCFTLVFPQLLTGIELYQNKTLHFSPKTH